MKGRQLAVLAALVVVLFGVRFFLSRRDREVASDLSGAGIARLLPESLEAKDVRWVKVSSPTDPASTTPTSLRVARSSTSGSDWVVSSAGDAPAESSAVNTFVETAVALSGEERGAGTQRYADFGVDDAHAVKVELGTTDPDKPAATLWLGKVGDRPDAHFVRVEGSERISHASEGLRTPLGLWSDTAKPDPDHWLKRDLLTIDSASLKTVTLDRPDVRYVFEQIASATPATSSPIPQPGSDAPPSPPPPAKEWSVTAPANLAWAVRKDSLSSTLGRVGTVKIDGVADPAACSGATPTSKVTLAEDSGTSHEIKVGAKLADKNDVAMQLTGDPHCYRLAAYSVNALMPRAAGLFDVPAAWSNPPAATAVKKITYVRGGTTIRLAQPEDGTWTIESPENGKADPSRVARLVSGVTGIRVDDLAETSKVPADLLKAEATITLQAGAKSLTVVLLGKRLGGVGEERYVRIQGGSAVPAGYVGVVADYTAQSLLATLKELKAAS